MTEIKMAIVDQLQRRLSLSTARQLAFILLVFIAGFFVVRWAIGGGTLPLHRRSESLVFGLGSLNDGVSRSDIVVKVRITGSPASRGVVSTSGTTTIVQKDVEADVLQYLKGRGAGSILVAQDFEIHEGGEPAIPVETYVGLPKDHTYVLFLRHEVSADTWLAFAQPIGFETKGNTLIPVRGRLSVSPSQWGLSGYDDLARKVKEILGAATQTPVS